MRGSPTMRTRHGHSREPRPGSPASAVSSPASRSNRRARISGACRRSLVRSTPTPTAASAYASCRSRTPSSVEHGLAVAAVRRRVSAPADRLHQYCGTAALPRRQARARDRDPLLPWRLARRRRDAAADRSGGPVVRWRRHGCRGRRRRLASPSAPGTRPAARRRDRNRRTDSRSTRWPPTARRHAPSAASPSDPEHTPRPAPVGGRPVPGCPRATPCSGCSSACRSHCR